jgi:hypothetical protein
MVRQRHLHLTSTWRGDLALYLPDTGPYAGRGPRRKYRSKVDDANMPEQSLQETTREEHIQTRVYQVQLLPKAFDYLPAGFANSSSEIHARGYSFFAAATTASYSSVAWA